MRLSNSWHVVWTGRTEEQNKKGIARWSWADRTGNDVNQITWFYALLTIMIVYYHTMCVCVCMLRLDNNLDYMFVRCFNLTCNYCNICSLIVSVLSHLYISFYLHPSMPLCVTHPLMFQLCWSVASIHFQYRSHRNILEYHCKQPS